MLEILYPSALEAERSRNESKKARWLERAFHSPGGRFTDCFEMLSLLDGLLTDGRLHQMQHQILGHLLLVGDFWCERFFSNRPLAPQSENNCTSCRDPTPIQMTQHSERK